MKTTYAGHTPNVVVPHLEQSHPIDWPTVFSNHNGLVVEIGFGNGEYLIDQARKDPTKNFVGIELTRELIQKAMDRLTHVKVSNVRLVHLDAAVALERLFAPRSIDRIYSLFPFPWPKKRHTKKRLFKASFLKLANSRLKDKGTLTIVTDFKPYVQWVLTQVMRTGFRAETREIQAQFDTKFERKWTGEGQNLFFELCLSKTAHIAVAEKRLTDIPSVHMKAFDPQGVAPRSVTGRRTIVFKKFIFDETRQEGRQSVFIVEGDLTQRTVFVIQRGKEGWTLRLSDDAPVLRTEGVREGLKRFAKACQKSSTRS